MIDLNTVVQAIAEHSLKLLRTADSIRIEGSCSAELAKAIEHHAASLLPFAAIAPEAAEEIAEQQAAADSDSIRQQLDEFGEWFMKYAGRTWPCFWEEIDQRVATVVDSQDVKLVKSEIQAIMSEVEAITWAAEIFPLSYEVEAKHAVESGAAGAGLTKMDDETPF